MGKIIKKLREQQRLSRVFIAKQTGIDRSTIKRIEEGGECSYSKVVAIVDALGYEIGIIIK